MPLSLEEALRNALSREANRVAYTRNPFLPRGAALALIAARKPATWRAAIHCANLTFDDIYALGGPEYDDRTRSEAAATLRTRDWQGTITWPEVTEALCDHYEEQSNPVGRYLAARSTECPERLERLAADSSRYVAHAVCDNTHSPEEALVAAAIAHGIAAGGAISPDAAREIVASRPGEVEYLTTSELVTIRESDRPGILSTLAERPDCPVEVLEDLCVHPNVNVAHCAGANPAVAPLIPRLLAEGATDSALAGFAANPAAPPAVFEALAVSGNTFAVSFALENPRCAADQRDRLLRSEHLDASDLADDIEEAGGYHFFILDGVSSPKQPVLSTTVHALASGSDSGRRLLAALCWALDADTNHTLASDTDPTVRAAIAQRPDTASDDLARLAADAEAVVVAAAVCNENTPYESVAALVDHPDEEVRHMVVMRGDMGDGVLLRVLQDADSDAATTVIAREPLVGTVPFAALADTVCGPDHRSVDFG